MSAGNLPATTRHYVRWGEHEPLVALWTDDPPVHPQNPRYRAYEIAVDGQYSWFERLMNVFRDRGWLDAPPADYKWAVVTVSYRAPKDPMDRFRALPAVSSYE
jgi:hypothetical protein